MKGNNKRMRLLAEKGRKIDNKRIRIAGKLDKLPGKIGKRNV